MNSTARTAGKHDQRQHRAHLQLLRAWLGATNPELRARIGRLLDLRRDPSEKAAPVWTVQDDFALANARGCLMAARMDERRR